MSPRFPPSRVTRLGGEYLKREKAGQKFSYLSRPILGRYMTLLDGRKIKLN